MNVTATLGASALLTALATSVFAIGAAVYGHRLALGWAVLAELSDFGLNLFPGAPLLKIEFDRLAFRAASGDLSYYVEPDEFLAQIDGNTDGRWRVGGRVVEGSIVERDGRPVAFDIAGDSGERISVTYEEGVVPNLFTANAFVVVEGGLHADGHFDATKLVIKHENEFFSDTPPPDSPSADLLPDD